MAKVEGSFIKIPPFKVEKDNYPVKQVGNGKNKFSTDINKTHNIQEKTVNFKTYGGQPKMGDIEAMQKPIKLDQNEVAYQYRLNGMGKQVTTANKIEMVKPQIMKNGRRDEIRQNGK